MIPGQAEQEVPVVEVQPVEETQEEKSNCKSADEQPAHNPLILINPAEQTSTVPVDEKHSSKSFEPSFSVQALRRKLESGSLTREEVVRKYSSSSRAKRKTNVTMADPVTSNGGGSNFSNIRAMFES